MDTIRTGIELELWVVDSSGRLSDGTAVADAHDRIETEFVAPMVEVQTAPHTDTEALRHDLQSTLGTAIRAAEAADLALAPLGTPLTASECEPNCARGHLFEAIYGDGITAAKNCAGTHVHFEQSEVGRQLDLLTALDPALALVSTSPYYEGEGGVVSSRAQAYRRKCGPAFREFCDLWSYTDSVEAWRERVEAAYESFRELAAERGVPPETVDRYFCPEDTVLNPVRLRECQPTVEWRAPDAALPSQVVQLATDVGELVAETETRSLDYGQGRDRTDGIQVPTMPRLRELSHQAIHTGLETHAVRTYLEGMGFDLDDYQPQSAQLHDRQTITEARARECRLDQARRMREDVASLTERHEVPGISATG